MTWMRMTDRLIAELTTTTAMARDIPEDRLLLAVLERAMDDLHTPSTTDHPRRAQEIIRDARAWLADESHTHAFSFVAICDHFGWTAAAVRRWLGVGVDKPCRPGVKRQPCALEPQPRRAPRQIRHR